MLILHETYDHWSVAVLIVTVHSSFSPTFDIFKKYVALCTGFNLLTPIFMLPYIIMDLPIFFSDKFWLSVGAKGELSIVHTSANTESIQICSVMGKYTYTVI